MRSIRAAIRLTGDTSIDVIEVGDFDTASGELRSLLTKYLRRALGRDDTAGTGATVRFVIQSHAAQWQDLPRASLVRVADVDAFEITIAGAPEPTVLIADDQ